MYAPRIDTQCRLPGSGVSAIPHDDGPRCAGTTQVRVATQAKAKGHETRADQAKDLFDNIEMFDTPRRKHARNGMLSPGAYQIKQQK